MRRCAAQLRCLFAIRTPSATACAESRDTPADPSRGQGISPNYVWPSRYTAGLSSRNPLTLWTSGEPPRGRGSIPHAGGSRHQHRCGAEIPATAGRPRSPHRRHAPDAAGQRGATPGNSISRGPLRNKKRTTGGWEHCWRIVASHRWLADGLSPSSPRSTSTAETREKNHDKSKLCAHRHAGRRIISQRNRIRSDGLDAGLR